MTTKTIDAKGRLVLDRLLANKTVIVEKIDELEYRVRLARVVPEREAWLLNNKQARESVMRGLKQASEGDFAAAKPDLDADKRLAEADAE